MYIVAAVVGLLFALWLFPREFILGNGAYWAAPRCDPLTHVIGMRYFMADEWHFPLLRTQLIAPPHGVNIIYTDSLPLMALVAKLLRAWLPTPVNYFGIWWCLTYVLQAVSIVFVLRSLEVKGVVPNLAGIVIALSFPPMLHRVWHAALSGHFLILFALGLYFRIASRQAFRRLWGWFALLCWTALLVHAYLFVMVFGVFCAAAAQEALSSRAGFGRSALAGTVVTAVSALLMWVSGYFDGMGDVMVETFGSRSMNVLSPWVPQRSGLFPTMGDIIDATGGQRAAFNYLGIGVLLLLAVALWVGRFEIVSSLRKYWGLALLLLVFTLLAVSNRVFVGQREVLTIGGSPSWLLQQFGASGRFFWPVGYTLMAIGIAVVALRLRRPWGPLGAVLIVAAGVLQFIDAGPLRQRVAASARDPGKLAGGCRSHGQLLVPAEPWRALIAAHGKLTVVPSFPCASPLQWHVLDFVFHASASATPVNTVYLARQKALDCDTERLSLDGYTLGRDELLVLLSPPINGSGVAGVRGFDDLCRSFEGGYVCSGKWGALDKAGLTGGLSKPPSPLRRTTSAPTSALRKAATE